MVKRSQAFTLIEILLVVAIIGILAMAGTSSIRNIYILSQLESERNTLARWMEFQQEKAITIGKDQTLTVTYLTGSPDKYTVDLQTIEVKNLDLSNSLGVSPQVFTFKPDGSVDNGTVVLKHPAISQEYKIIVKDGVISVEP